MTQKPDTDHITGNIYSYQEWYSMNHGTVRRKKEPV